MTRSEAPGRLARRILICGPAGEPLWVRLYGQDMGLMWAAMIVADAETPPEPGELKGLFFFADTAEEAERLALASLGEGVAEHEGAGPRGPREEPGEPPAQPLGAAAAGHGAPGARGRLLGGQAHAPQE